MNLQNLKPDTPKEIALIASSISRLGAALAGITLFQDHKLYTLGAVLLTWLGHEVNQYINHSISNSQTTKPQNHDPDNSN